MSKLLNESGIEVNGKAPHDFIIHNDKVFNRTIYDGTLGLAESYVDGWWSCKKLDEYFYKIFKHGIYQKITFPWDRLIYYLTFHAFNLQTLKRSREVADKHYDIGNHIFKSFLDENMNYTCGYWKDAKNLDEAQIHKMDLICQKLKLKPGMRVLDLGCGWGGLCKFLAEKYNVEVVGVTNSKECAAEARIRCKGLKVDIRVHDYRELNDVFDRIVVVGFLEHVGRKNYRSLFKLAHQWLADDGIFLIQTIGHDNDSTPPMELFIHKYIFPNAMLPDHKNIPTAIDNLFCIEDWHSFGTDYDKTLMAWNDNFTKNWPAISHMFENPESTFRIWTYYFLMCAALFRARKAQLWQIVLTKGLAGGYVSVR